MISQLRIYTVNRGMMDQWVKHFTEVVRPMMESHGAEIGGMWVNEDNNQFIWIRSFAGSEDAETQMAAWGALSEWRAIRERVFSYLARLDTQIMTPVAKVAVSA
ncbi:MAG: hypothetical protein CMJ45_09355 [Planctomyces sp.]|nr:hypothetical protein [Planctomyces sp.]